MAKNQTALLTADLYEAHAYSAKTAAIDVLLYKADFSGGGMSLDV
ncbi:hypothetical protein [Pseudarthrobacter phenanthrenivorans]|nr:hypothetical protein [Pseudarthrobacter phenanthrenivorans]